MDEKRVQLLKAGPFPGVIDPWAEQARPFQQLHSGIIEHILGQIQEPLLALGYLAGKETSLQILEGRQPDVFVERRSAPPAAASGWNSVAAAQAVMAEPGLEAEAPERPSLPICCKRSAMARAICPSRRC